MPSLPQRPSLSPFTRGSRFLVWLSGCTALALLPSLAAAPSDEIPLWEDQAVPGETGDVPAEVSERKDDGIERTRNVSLPTLKFYPAPADSNQGTTVLVCPGGGYSILASEHEGSKVCEWLNGIGVNAALLKYRVPRRKGLPKHQAPLQDAHRALSLLRSNATEWKIDPDKIGVLGFSAGGHLATMALTEPERTFPTGAVDAASHRPNFAILIYPAYLVHEADPSQLAAEVKVDAETPPVFIAVATDDKWSSSSARLYAALVEAKVPAEMHAFTHGGHGFGITKQQDKPVAKWPDLAAEWLAAMGWIAASGE